MSSSFSLRHFNMVTNPSVKLFGAEPDDVSQVADEPVGELLVVDFVKNVSSFVVAQSPAQLFVVHGRLALLLAPQLGHALRLAHDELAVQTA